MYPNSTEFIFLFSLNCIYSYAIIYQRGDYVEVERKRKLNITEQIKHMNDKGIQFNVENEEFATDYLTNNT